MGEKGQAIVEFALVVSLVLFPIIFALIDLSVMFYVQLTMQRAVREGARYAVTGQTGDSGDRRAELVRKIKEGSMGLYDKNDLPQKDPTVSVVTTSSTQYFDNYTGTPVSDTGKPNDIIIVSLPYAWPLMTPFVSPFFDDGRFEFIAKSTMRNEPW